MISRNSILTFLAAILVVMLPVTGFTAEKSSNQAFSDLLNEAGLKFKHPENFKEVAIRGNELLRYEYALSHNSLPLETRYIIRPIQRLTIEYQDPHNSAPEPNHIFPMLFSSIVDSLSLDGNSPRHEYSTAVAQKKFNADWAAAAVFDIHPEFSKQYKQALLLAMHKNSKSDAYVIYLFNDYEKTKTAINASMGSLVFN